MENEKKDQIRTLKVYSRFIIPSFGRARILPEIRLTGKWLEKWGINSGEEIKVIKVEGGIYIRYGTQEPPIIEL
ncbi:MAG TPA: hypothetical protein PLC65_17010 [Bacteroidia bacterium]|nr:hypothetical protein [Bacteroidia bacterium]